MANSTTLGFTGKESFLTFKQQPWIKSGIATGEIKGELRTEISIYDEMTGELNMATDLYQRALPPILYKMGLDLKRGVAREYSLAQIQYQNSIFTAMVKGGKPALEYSGSLKRAMRSLEGIQPVNNPNSKGVKVTWEIPESRGTGEFPEYRKANDVEYLWFHEFGRAMMPKKLIFLKSLVGTRGGAGYRGLVVVDRKWTLKARPFFLRGLEKGRKQATVRMRKEVVEFFTQHIQEPRYKARWLQVSPVPKFAPGGMAGFAMYFAPPSQLYKYPGMWGDFMGVASGALFSERAVLGYVRQYAWGQIGMTRKSIRRKFRRRLYYSR